VIPFVAFPLGLAAGLRRSAAPGERAMAALAAAVVPLVAVQVALFSTTEFSIGRIHERYLTYAAPFALLMLALWVERGMPRTRWLLGVAALVACVAPFALPGIGGIEPSGFDAPALTALGYPADPGVVGGGRIVVVFACVVLVGLLVLARSRRSKVAVLGLVALAFLFVNVTHHRDLSRAARDVERWAAGGPTDLPRDWIDRAVGKHVAVTAIVVGADQACPRAFADNVVGDAAIWSVSFYNTGFVEALGLGRRPNTAVPGREATLRPSGELLVDGQSVRASYAVIDDRVELVGSKVTADRPTRLALWRVDGPLRVAGTLSPADVRAAVCGRAGDRF
jgi:hypothetical protein